MSQTMLTKKQVAEILQVSPRTVNRLVAARQLKALRIGHILRVDPAEVERLKRRYTS